MVATAVSFARSLGLFMFAFLVILSSTSQSILKAMVKGFAARSYFLGHQVNQSIQMKQQHQRQQISTSSPQCFARTTQVLVMRDMSASYWFSVGDAVKVVQDVYIRGGSINLRGRKGIVKETWEKCDVDPTCCCAEQVDIGMAVRVEFLDYYNEQGSDSSFLHYFAEEELAKVTTTTKQGATEDSSQVSDVSAIESSETNAKDQMSFDGMSCVAFKVDQLKSNKPRNLSSYDPNAMQ